MFSKLRDDKNNIDYLAPPPPSQFVQSPMQNASPKEYYDQLYYESNQILL